MKNCEDPLIDDVKVIKAPLEGSPRKLKQATKLEIDEVTASAIRRSDDLK